MVLLFVQAEILARCDGDMGFFQQSPSELEAVIGPPAAIGIDVKRGVVQARVTLLAKHHKAKAFVFMGSSLLSAVVKCYPETWRIEPCRDWHYCQCLWAQAGTSRQVQNRQQECGDVVLAEATIFLVSYAQSALLKHANRPFGNSKRTHWAFALDARGNLA